MQQVRLQMEKGVVTWRDVARQFACNIAGDQLEEGRHHFYRGVLTDTGRALLALYAESWEEDVNRNFTTKEKASKEIAAMHEIIKSIG